jgi:hypothetical protein
MDIRRAAGAAAILLVAIAMAGVPAVARSVVKFARNAAHVDGISAIRSKSCVKSSQTARPDCSSRAGKLVAADDDGYLPNDMIRKAKDSARLGGTDADRFVQRCADAAAGYADIPAQTAADWVPVVRGFGEVREYGGPPRADTGQASIDRCTLTGVAARRRSAGVYEVAPFATFRSFCDTGLGGGRPIPAVATVNDERPLLITYETLQGCDSEQGIVLRVHIYTTEGVPADASFSMAFLEAAQILYP